MSNKIEMADELTELLGEQTGWTVDHVDDGMTFVSWESRTLRVSIIEDEDPAVFMVSFLLENGGGEAIEFFDCDTIGRVEFLVSLVHRVNELEHRVQMEV